jgi:hypothetical protein
MLKVNGENYDLEELTGWQLFVVCLALSNSPTSTRLELLARIKGEVAQLTAPRHADLRELVAGLAPRLDADATSAEIAEVNAGQPLKSQDDLAKALADMIYRRVIHNIYANVSVSPDEDRMTDDERCAYRFTKNLEHACQELAVELLAVLQFSTQEANKAETK